MRDERPVIVGASIAGATCALGLARAGRPSVVLERRRSVADKVCGEGLQPLGRALLEEFLPDLAAKGHAYRGFAFHSRGRAPIAWDFPDGVAGLGIERAHLDRALRDALEAEPLIDLRTGTSAGPIERGGDHICVRAGAEILHTKCLVGADGVASAVRAAAGLDTPRLRGRFGARLRFDAAPPPAVQIHFADGHEIYVTPLNARTTSVALLGDEAFVRGLDEGRALAALDAAGARPAGPTKGPLARLPHIGAGVRRPAARGVFLCGDAALVLDPISGAGMTLGALGGTLLARALVEGRDMAEKEHLYVRPWRRAVRPFRALTGFLLGVARSRAVRAGAWTLLRRHPAWIERCARPTFQGAVRTDSA